MPLTKLNKKVVEVSDGIGSERDGARRLIQGARKGRSLSDGKSERGNYGSGKEGKEEQKILQGRE